MCTIRLHLEAAGSIYFNSSIIFDSLQDAGEAIDMLRESYPGIPAEAWEVEVF